ncbi:hypothetical protein OPV22_014548 [Ensete ventricosum]|uniref:RING-type domain-containing protein n=1 Tax=Ensete ventricosum TaxID=4639 RepID=A0AAV8R8A3_ENSVE|nr:hypothetical protein OPV22_014548 [Ensete ventricosum]
MGSDDGSHAAMSRDIARRKKTNRSAKLKQCKLDARREQWLSQVKSKDCVVRSRAPSGSPPLPHPTLSKELGRVRKEEEEEHRDEVGRHGSSFHGSEEGSPTHRSHLPGCPNNNSVSSGSSIGSSSRSISDAEVEEDDSEERGEDKGEVEDWEAFADALSADQPNPNPPVATIPESTAAPGNTIKDPGEGLEKPDAKQAVHRAWRPDDAFRPRSLPNLSKQRSFPASMERHYAAAGWAQHGVLSAPSSCPICYEDLDPTDSSFLPCNCGFRLCLFCHKRILEADGRCPGCRKHYAPVAGGEVGTVRGIAPSALRFSRSCSMSSRT